MHIDDDLSLVKFVAKHNPKTRFLWLNDKTEKKPISQNVFPILSLSDILRRWGIIPYSINIWFYLISIQSSNGGQFFSLSE